MENNKFEAAQYSYENAGQFRSIAKILGYKEELKENGNITFSKGNEQYTYSIEELKKGNRKPDREDITLQSKERVVAFFNKEEASSNFKEYNQHLLKSHNLAIVKWDNIKQGEKSGFTVIDLDKKVAYTGEELYRFAYEKNHKLDGKGGRIDVNWKELNDIGGIDPSKLSKEDKENLRNGQKTGTLKFAIEDTPKNREYLDKEKVSYTAENGKLKFEGKAAASKYIMLDNTEENKSKLKSLDIDFKENGKQLKVSGANARKLAIAAIAVVYPVAGIALMLVPKRQEIKNDFSLSKDEINALKNDAVIAKKNEKGERILYQRDKETNDIVSIKAKDIQIPTRIAGVELTPMQMEKLKNGHEIVIINETLNKAAKVRLDLNAKNGLSIKEANNIEITKEAKQSTERTVSDRERLEFVAKNGAKGIDEVFKNKPSELDSFLEKYNLKKDYASYKEVERTFSSSKEATGKTTGEKISSQLDKLDAAIKATAHKEASNIYGRSYGHNESSKMKI